MKAPIKDALSMLGEVHTQPRFLLASEGEVRVGVGIHRRLEEGGPDALRVIAHASRQLAKESTVFGGFAFDPEVPSTAPWQAFPKALFAVPSLEWEWLEDEWTERRNGPTARMPDLPGNGKAASSRDPPEERDWPGQVAQALEQVGSGHLAKVVLARAEAGPPLRDALESFSRLAASEPDAHLFFFEPTPGFAFFGATPERLARLRRGRLETHAVAGTAPRGDKGSDAALGQKLLGGGKESHEHRLVVDHILEALQGMGLSPEQGMRRLKRMAKVQHLETQIGASASAGLHVLDVAAALHPTPAVCGTPTGPARKLIAHLEATPRGWYAGGIGWFNQKGEGDLFVALRSALATPEGTWIYAGAGITAGSDAALEFKETEAKLKSMQEALA